MLQIAKGTLKNVTEDWHQYINGKTLLLISGFAGGWVLSGIEGEDSLKDMCKYVWDNFPDISEGYECLEDYIEEVALGNDGFGFDEDEITVFEIMIEADLDKLGKGG